MKILRGKSRLLTMPRLTAMTIVVAVILSSQVAGASTLQASWYSRTSLIKEGTWKNGKEKKMANGKTFDETKATCAANGYPLGTILKITSTKGSVICEVTDRISKKYGETRIDLTPMAARCIMELSQGLADVKVERIR